MQAHSDLSSKPMPRHPARLTLRFPLLAALLLAPGLACWSGCAAVDNVVADAISAPASDIRARGGADAVGPHVLMTRATPAHPGDRPRADALAQALRRSTEKYQDVERALDDGYEPFPANPPPTLEEIHYVHRDRSGREARQIDPQQPGALLYRRTAGGGLRLVGAMVTAPAEATLEELDARVPLSVTQWHLHTNICVPKPLWDGDQWARALPSGEPAFGPDSPIATEAACQEVGGRFLPTVFGWMAHAYVYLDGDPWSMHGGHGMAGHRDEAAHH